MTETVRIYVQRERISKRGPLYTARLGSPDGEILASSTMEPALAAARSLIAKGYDTATVLEMWDAERPFPRLRGILGVMARQTVLESEKSGPRFGKYIPFQDASSRVRGKAKTGGQPVSGIEGASDAPASVRTNCDGDPDLSGEAAS